MYNLKKKKEIIEEPSNIAPCGYLLFKKEYVDLPNNLIPQAKLELNDKDIMNFKVTYRPEKDSLWYTGIYEFSISVHENYPYNAPKVKCNTKIYHPNIDYEGNVCLNILKEDWKPTLTMSSVIAGIYFLFYEPNAKDPLNHDAAETMRDNYDGFVSNVKRSLKGGKMFGEEFPKFSK